VSKVSMVAWSLGGPRAGGYTAAHPERVQKLVLLAPHMLAILRAQLRQASPPNGAPFNTQSREEFVANWDRQVGCANQYDPAALDSVWSEMMASDPIGATWGTGVRRAPNTTNWGWSTALSRTCRHRR
jgi:pimeloyl-ACP methyl ester carboxylesterase